jgi:hypothetical protein
MPWVSLPAYGTRRPRVHGAPAAASFARSPAISAVTYPALRPGADDEYTGSKLAREVNRLTGWSRPVFERRYTMIPVSNEEATQVEVLTPIPSSR